MLGIRTAPKEDLGTSSAEEVFDAPLTIPTDFLGFQPGDQTSPDQQLHQLRTTVGDLAPVPTSQHGPVTPFVPHTLQVTPYIFICKDGHRNPLQSPYTGPYKVLERGPKFFKIDMSGRPENVFIDCLAEVSPHSEIAESNQASARTFWGGRSVV